jgi:hypothetical protein
MLASDILVPPPKLKVAAGHAAQRAVAAKPDLCHLNKASMLWLQSRRLTI